MRKYGVFKVWSTKIGSFLAFLAILQYFQKIFKITKKYLEPDFKKYLYPNTRNFNTLYISIGIFDQKFMSRVKNRDYLGKNMKKIAKIVIFKLRFLRPEKGFRPPLKGYLAKITYIFFRPNYFSEFSKFELSRSNFPRKTHFSGAPCGALF